MVAQPEGLKAIEIEFAKNAEVENGIIPLYLLSCESEEKSKHFISIFTLPTDEADEKKYGAIVWHDGHTSRFDDVDFSTNRNGGVQVVLFRNIDGQTYTSAQGAPGKRPAEEYYTITDDQNNVDSPFKQLTCQHALYIGENINKTQDQHYLSTTILDPNLLSS